MRKLPAPEQAAYFLDLDGTLIDIAPAPDQVRVPAALPGTLGRLRDRAGGALAVVSGRPIAEIDALLGDAPHAVAGQHGAEIRHRPGQAVERPRLPDLPPEWLASAETMVAANPGTRLEAKRHGFVLHFRAAPAAGPTLRAALATLLEGNPDFAVMTTKMAWEVRPVLVNKGRAVQSLMQQAPFAGRAPVYVGDDVTDEDGIAAAEALGGVGLRVEPAFGDPAGVRAWLAELAA